MVGHGRRMRRARERREKLPTREVCGHKIYPPEPPLTLAVILALEVAGILGGVALLSWIVTRL